ncbi:MAG: hypothetical protein ACOCTI_04635 [Phycisphaeraceae bacterium]
MRAVVSALVLLILLHVFVAVGFVGWLGASGRLSRERVDEVVDTFRLTVDEQQDEDQEAAEQAEQELELADEAARLEAASDGPRTMSDRLATRQQGDALARHRLEFLQQTTQNIQQQIERAREVLARQKADFEAEREAFRKQMERELEQRRDEDFQEAVRMVEQLPAEQAKGMFQQLMAEGDTEQVVDYLAAMQVRKAGAVLEEFEGPQEVGQVTDLIERLRERNAYPPALSGELAQE